ncbi:MAG: hypothetical protein J0H14_06830 [Alphaproteobacteria bacterium]|nr:hypothetical protein [Alphaproteobacteria bacterium]
MPATVFTLAESSDRTGYVLGVFANRDRAIAAARANVIVRAARCRIQDVKTFGVGADRQDDYEIILRVVGETTDVVIAHVPSGENDGMRWQIRAFEVIEP